MGEGAKIRAASVVKEEDVEARPGVIHRLGREHGPAHNLKILIVGRN
jgi:hypothetical protein